MSYDVTTLPYYLRHGDVAVIGVGGGRDLLSAHLGRQPAILGVDVNQIMIDLLKGAIAGSRTSRTRPEVRSSTTMAGRS